MAHIISQIVFIMPPIPLVATNSLSRSLPVSIEVLVVADTIIALIVVPVILIGVAIIMFTGSIAITYNEKSFTVDSTYYDALTINYDDIESIEVKENVSIGVKEFAFNSAKLSLGKFRNDEFGSHTRYTYNSCKTVVVMKIDGKTLVINDKDDDVTREIYLKIKSETGE